jgi:hypothetical protein
MTSRTRTWTDRTEVAGAAALLGLLGLALAGHRVIQAEHAMAHARHLSAEASRMLAAAESASASMPRQEVASTDFTARLPLSAPVSEVLAELQRACAANGVSLHEVRSRQRAAAASQLGLVTLAIHVHGRYPKVMQMLSEVHGRFDFITLQSLAMTAASKGEPADDARISLSLWSRPVPSPAPPARR